MPTVARSTEGGVPELTDREEEVLGLLLEGRPEKEIARELKLSPETVATHRKNIYQKVGVHRRPELMNYYATHAPPPSKAGALAGLWLSRYDYERFVPDPAATQPRFQQGAQINLELVEPDHGFFNYKGRNLRGARAEALPPYDHEFRIRVMDYIAVGIWLNTNSHNTGCFQMFVQPSGRGMHGTHLGNTSARVIKAGPWIWLKVEAPPSFAPGSRRFLPFADLAKIVEDVRDSGRTLREDELFVRE